MKRLNYLQTPDPIWRPYVFDRVIITAGVKPVLCLLDKCYSEYRDGPNLCTIADATGELLGPGAYGHHSSRFLGWREGL